jgi:glycine hydroxymethyltransferase
VVDVLSNTEPGTTKSGTPSKASHVLADGVADRTHAASNEMLDRHPLYPGLELS